MLEYFLKKKRIYTEFIYNIRYIHHNAKDYIKENSNNSQAIIKAFGWPPRDPEKTPWYEISNEWIKFCNNIK